MENKVVTGWVTRSSWFKRLALNLAEDFVRELLDPAATEPVIGDWVTKIAAKLEPYPEAKQVFEQVTKTLTPKEIAELIQTVATTLLQLIPRD